MADRDADKRNGVPPSEKKTGRGRGRARGRASVGANGQPAANRPGSVPHEPLPQQAQPPSAAAAMTSAGTECATRDRRPGGGDVTAAMEGRSLGNGASGTLALSGRGRATQRGATRERRPGGDVTAAMEGRSPGNGACGTMTSAGTGRATQRGATLETHRGGDVAAAMESLSLSNGASGGGACGGRRRDRDVMEPIVHTRPKDLESKQGSTGKPIQVVSNYFRLNQAPDWQLYQYHVDFSPEVMSRSLRMRLVKEQREMLGPTRAFDGMVLFLAQRLPQTKTEVFGVRQSDNAQIKITFRLTAELPPDSPVCIQIFNVIFRRILNMIHMEQIGRHYYDPQQGVQIPNLKLEVWPGFITSILQYENSVMLCAEISHKILRSDTMLDVMDDLYQNCRRGTFHDEFQKKYIGEIVLTPYNNKTYRIDDIDWEKNPSHMFKMKDGSEISIADYYLQHYNLRVTDLHQPLLVSQPKKRDQNRGQIGPILLVPELCRLTGLSDEVRADFRVMRDLASHTCLAPQERFTRLSNFNQRLSSNQEVVNELAGWKLGFDKNLVNVNARVLPPEDIYQRDVRSGRIESYRYKPSKAEWSQEMRKRDLISCIALPPKEWVLITPAGRSGQDLQHARDFLRTLQSVGPPMGLNIGDPHFEVLNRDNSGAYDEALKRVITSDTKMVVCIVPNNRKDRYDAIKKRVCLLTPVPSQVIVLRTLTNRDRLMSVATKIAIQMNCKLGGEVWGVDIPLKGLMVIGIDTYHDSSRKGRSVGAFVASTNQNLTKYYSRCNFQMNSQEMIDGLTVNMKAALEEYRSVNQALPTKIIVYRDGVGDGQLPIVLEHEIPQLLACFKAAGQEYDPKLSFVVVTKRITTRFFARDRRAFQNPPPGTVVDSEVTKPEWYDFFLVSQSVRQGTVTPTHYNVVWDTITFSPDQMQRLTYKLTHLYYNWPGTIRVPAPCQYAHKLAFLVGQSLHEDPRKELRDKLFFL